MSAWIGELLEDGFEETGRRAVFVERDKHGYWSVNSCATGERLMTALDSKRAAECWAARRGHYLDRSDSETLAILMRLETDHAQ